MTKRPAAGRAPRIGILTVGDASSVRTWSGTPFYMTRELERRAEHMQYLGPMPQFPRRVLKAFERLSSIAMGRNYNSGFHEPLPRIYARATETQLRDADLDLIFAIASSPAIKRLKTDLPIVYCSDATVRLMRDYNPEFSNVEQASVEAAEQAEQAAIRRADLLVYPTEWVARSAVEDYGADPDRIRILPFGANLEPEDLPSLPLRDVDRSVCRILMVGVNWKYKGGDIAVEAFRMLRARGMNVEMHIVGTTPPEPIEIEGLTIIPFLNKKDPQDKATFDRLFREADIFMLPTQADCFGIVFHEAAAFGVPSVATATGGVPDVVRDGETGRIVAQEQGPAGFADAVESIWSDADTYAGYRARARARFEQVGNWSAWGDAFEQAIAPLLERGRG